MSIQQMEKFKPNKFRIYFCRYTTESFYLLYISVMSTYPKTINLCIHSIVVVQNNSFGHIKMHSRP